MPLIEQFAFIRRKLKFKLLCSQLNKEVCDAIKTNEKDKDENTVFYLQGNVFILITKRGSQHTIKCLIVKQTYIYFYRLDDGSGCTYSTLFTILYLQIILFHHDW